MNTDEAWEAYEKLVDEYYRIKETGLEVPKTFAEALRLAADQAEVIQKQQKEIEYKETVIIGLVDEVDLATKRQILNRVVRYGRANYQDRWRELYKQFEMKYHLKLSTRLETYNADHKPKLKNKIDYIDKIMSKIPELYEIACKLYENDVKELIAEIYELNNRLAVH